MADDGLSAMSARLMPSANRVLNLQVPSSTPASAPSPSPSPETVVPAGQPPPRTGGRRLVAADEAVAPFADDIFVTAAIWLPDPRQ